MAGGARLEVDTGALRDAGTILHGVSSAFVSAGGDVAGNVGIGDVGHPQLTFALADFSEQALRIAADLEGAVSGLGNAATGAAGAYDATEQGIAAGMSPRG